MKHVRHVGCVLGLVLGSIAGLITFASGVTGSVLAQSLPNPYRIVDGWAQLPNARPMGAVGKVAIDPDGRHIWAVIRCDALADPARFGDECRDSKTDAVYKFEPDGKVVKSFGGGMFIWPHGLDVDREGNVWVTDAVAANRTPPGDKRGQQVVKFSPDGKVLMTLGTPGVAGQRPDHFNSPSDIVVAPNGDLFVADGHNEDGNNRVVKFSKDGHVHQGLGPDRLRAWRVPDAARHRDRFAGTSLRRRSREQPDSDLRSGREVPRRSGRSSAGRAVSSSTRSDQIYVADSESDDVQNPGWEMGIRIGDARTGWISAFIQYPWGDPRETPGTGAEFVAVDRDGNLYGGEPRPKKLQKYVRVRP